MYHSLFNHSSVEGHLAGFQFGSITNKAAVKTCTSFYVNMFFLSSGEKKEPRITTAGLNSSCMFNF